MILLAGTKLISAAPIKLRVMAELANIRLKPSISSVIIRQLPEGSILEAVRKEGEWYLVKLEPDESGAASGYVHESLVLPFGEIPKTARQPQVAEPPLKKEKERPQRTERGTQEIQPAEVGAEPLAPSWTFTLSAGANYAQGGDLNRGAKGLADFFGARLGAEGDRTVAPVHISYLFGGEVAVALFSRFYIAAGADFFLSSRETQISYSPDTTASKFRAKPRFQAVPAKLAIVFYPAKFFCLKLGVAYYFAKCSYYYRYENNDFWQEWRGEASANSFGYFGGLGFELAFADNLSLVVEALGQYAPIKEFKGTNIYLDSDMNEPYQEQGQLYAYDAISITTQKIFPFLFIGEKKPSKDAYVENQRPATVDFSGFSLRMGFKVKY